MATWLPVSSVCIHLQHHHNRIHLQNHHNRIHLYNHDHEEDDDDDDDLTDGVVAPGREGGLQAEGPGSC